MLLRTHRQQRHAAVAHLLPFRHLISSLLVVSAVAIVQADTLHEGGLETPAFIAQIKAHTPQEVSDILNRLDGLLTSQSSFPSSQPLALVLHGDEASAFLRENYSQNKSLVDLAARLDAFNAVDIQICETWMRDKAVTKEQLPAFVDTVPFGPGEERSFIGRGYIYF